MKKKIIIICTEKHFENRDYKNFGINAIQNRKYDWEVWSLVNWVYTEKVKTPQRVAKDKRISCINDKLEFIEKFKREDVKKTFFIIYPGNISINNSDIQLFIRKYIKLHGGKYADYYYPCNFVSNIKKVNENNLKDVTKYYIDYLKNLNDVQRILKKIKIITYSIFFPSSLDFVQGKIGKYTLNNLYHIRGKKTVLLHTFDYDDYLSNKSKKSEIKGRYAVFIDQYLTGHSDFKKMNLNMRINERKYYGELNHFFDKLENLYDCKIVIAVHPKSEYRENPFGGREMYEYISDILIKDSLFCIFHYSTTFNHVLLYKKDFYQITSNELLKSNYMNHIFSNYKRILGNKILNLSDNYDEKMINRYDEKKYKKFVEEYIKGDYNNKSNMEIILDMLKNKW